MITMKKHLRICAVGNSSSIHVKKRTQCFADRGHEVSLISPVRNQIECVKNIYLPSHNNKAGLPGYIFRLIKAIREENPDIVHLHYGEVYQVTACYLSGFNFAVTLMGSDVMNGFGILAWPQRLLLASMLKKATLLNPKSQNIAAMVEHHIGKHPNTIVTYWGADFNKFKPINKISARQQLGFDLNTHLILSPRLLRSIYNIDLIVKALPIVLGQIDAKLLLCESMAEPEYKAQLQVLIAELNLEDRVIFLGEMTNDAMPLLYNAVDVAVGIPDHDGMPMSLLEGMACAVPNIIPKLKSYEELVIDKQSAYYVDLRESDIAEAIIELAKNEALREDICNNAYRTVNEKANFAVDVAKIEDAFLEIANDQ